MSTLLLGVCVGVAIAAPAHLNFVACPIARDTQTLPCWLAEYEGELYYLGVQGEWGQGVWENSSAPLMGHRVLVEGMVTDDYRICGGRVLRPVMVSQLPELDETCSSAVLPAEERYTVPFAKAQSPNVEEFKSNEFTLLYDFDAHRLVDKHSRALQAVLAYARDHRALRIEVIGYRGATLLSNGARLVEQEGIAERRARAVAQLLGELGLAGAKIAVHTRDEAASADGVEDFQLRRTTIALHRDH